MTTKPKKSFAKVLTVWRVRNHYWALSVCQWLYQFREPNCGRESLTVQRGNINEKMFRRFHFSHFVMHQLEFRNFFV